MDAPSVDGEEEGQGEAVEADELRHEKVWMDDNLDSAEVESEDRSYEVAAQRVLATARRTGCTAYDSQFLCLAEDLGLNLYTFDDQLISKSAGAARKPD